MIEALGIGDRKLMATRTRPTEQVPELPTIVYMGGLLADQLTNGTESRAFSLEQEAITQGFEFVRFNFTAHGNRAETRSSGEFSDITISRMIDDSICVLKYYGISKVAWVGSSIGAGMLPFLASRVEQELDVTNCGFFTISAMPPQALASFIYSQVNEEQKARLKAGNSVRIESPTLPFPVHVSPKQITDVEKYDYATISGRLTSNPVIGIAGTQDAVSTIDQNRILIEVLNGEAENLKIFDAPHDIPGELMNPMFRTWLNSLRVH